MIVLAVDGGFGAMGVARVLVRWPDVAAVGVGPTVGVARAGVVRTHKGESGLSDSQDNEVRTRRIVQFLREWMHGADAVVVEAMSHMQNASSAAKVAMALAAVYSTAEHAGLPIVQVSPQALKRVLGARYERGMDKAEAKARSKAAVRAAVDTRVGSLDAVLAHVPEGLREHPYDAVAVVLAALDLGLLTDLHNPAA